MLYIDLNMVRAGVVSHQAQWEISGYREIQRPPARYRIIDTNEVQRLLELDGLQRLQQTLAGWVDAALRDTAPTRVPAWSQSVAVGSTKFLETFRRSAPNLRHRAIDGQDGQWSLREMPSPFRREALSGAVAGAFCDRARRKRSRRYGEDVRPSETRTDGFWSGASCLRQTAPDRQPVLQTRGLTVPQQEGW